MADISKPVNQDITFTDLSHGGPTSFTWDFGDGTPPVTTAEPSVVHRYTKTGTYTITHQATGPGGTTTCHKTIEITAGFPIIVIPIAAVIIGGIIYYATRKPQPGG